MYGLFPEDLWKKPEHEKLNELDFSSNHTNKLSSKRWCDDRYEAYAFGVMSIFTDEIKTHSQPIQNPDPVD